MRSTLPVDVQRLGFSRKLEHNSVKVGSEARRGDGNAPGVLESTQAVAREQRAEEVKGSVGLFCADGCNAALTFVAVVWSQRWG